LLCWLVLGLTVSSSVSLMNPYLKVPMEFSKWQKIFVLPKMPALGKQDLGEPVCPLAALASRPVVSPVLAIAAIIVNQKRHNLAIMGLAVFQQKLLVIPVNAVIFQMVAGHSFLAADARVSKLVAVVA